eukprot:350151-Chlamydomonas_euryale.AAC.1
MAARAGTELLLSSGLHGASRRQPVVHPSKPGMPCRRSFPDALLVEPCGARGRAGSVGRMGGAMAAEGHRRKFVCTLLCHGLGSGPAQTLHTHAENGTTAGAYTADAMMAAMPCLLGRLALLACFALPDKKSTNGQLTVVVARWMTKFAELDSPELNALSLLCRSWTSRKKAATTTAVTAKSATALRTRRWAAWASRAAAAGRMHPA